LSLQDILGKSVSDFFRDRGVALLDAIIAAIALGLFALVYKRISKATFLIRYSLRMRLIAAIGILAVAAFGGCLLHTNSNVLLAFVFIGFGLLVQWILRDLSRVGITNAFETTRQGVSAEASLKEVKGNLVFLGIGAKKLTEKPEFDEMLKRCQAANGHVKFLLSHPENEALEDLAKQNGHHDLSYRSRVKESIRDIHARAMAAGVNFEIRLYNLKQKIALPHFRLMFIDERLCIFSQVFWNKSEGLDNPQLILRRNKDQAQSSLYQGYYNYFDDLWELDTTIKVDTVMLNSWAA